MLSGLLHATGAEVLRDDLADGNSIGQRVHKGMIEGRAVYIVETIVPCSVGEGDGEVVIFERKLTAETEPTVRDSLDELSEIDKYVLSTVGVSVPNRGADDYNVATYPSRSRMLGILRMCEAMNPVPGTENPDI
jgi:hypothetical protein